MIDLGRDVPPETIVETVKEKKYQTGRIKCADDDDAEEHGRNDRGCQGGGS